jgi:hypothetical protein
MRIVEPHGRKKRKTVMTQTWERFRCRYDTIAIQSETGWRDYGGTRRREGIEGIEARRIGTDDRVGKQMDDLTQNDVT